ncbi:MAG: ferrochelatase [Bernardetiaceae bacterium]|nr:ferrochelatase [Bernardetiaceae bacterium]
MATTAILLTNLGSPDSPAPTDVKKYLDEFLMDERVIDLPYWLRLPLVRGLITPLRSRQSAKKYQTIWTDQGSPLVHTTRQLTQLVAAAAHQPTYMCMRYANPTPQAVLAQIAKQHPDLKELKLVPLYPHYAMSSYETAVEHVKAAHRQGNYPFALTVVPPFYNQAAYVTALANSLRPHLNPLPDHVLFSYHGIPERHVKKTDPGRQHCLQTADCCNVAAPAHAFCYRHQVKETTRLVAQQLDLAPERHSFSFQSRLGTDRWLRPYTAELLGQLPKRGIRHLVIACPAFVSDCLETLEEIHEEGREIFLEAGGQTFIPVPCLNLNPDWVEALVHHLLPAAQ